MKNQRGHGVCWVSTGRKNGLMWRTHNNNNNNNNNNNRRVSQQNQSDTAHICTGRGRFKSSFKPNHCNSRWRSQPLHFSLMELLDHDNRGGSPTIVLLGPVKHCTKILVRQPAQWGLFILPGLAYSCSQNPVAGWGLELLRPWESEKLGAIYPYLHPFSTTNHF